MSDHKKPEIEAVAAIFRRVLSLMENPAYFVNLDVHSRQNTLSILILSKQKDTVIYSGLSQLNNAEQLIFIGLELSKVE